MSILRLLVGFELVIAVPFALFMSVALAIRPPVAIGIALSVVALGVLVGGGSATRVVDA